MYLTSLALRWFAATFCIILAQTALAHTASTSAVSIDIESHQVRITLQLPADQLALAEAALVPTTDTELMANSWQQLKLSALTQYLQKHIQLRNDSGTLLPVVGIDQLTVETHNGTPFLHIELTLVPEKDETLSALDLHYTVILHQVVTHKVYVTLQSDFTQGQVDNTTTPLGIIR
ncbi:MAG: hypothetical protein MI864_22640, partial [Pseudomonadales bacterium]|nr:hypothetical protein [Pseudomonadales bacterium]